MTTRQTSTEFTSPAVSIRRRCQGRRQMWTLFCVCLAVVLSQHTALAQDQPAATVAAGTPAPATSAPATPAPATTAPATTAPTAAPETPAPSPVVTPSPAPSTEAPTATPTPTPAPSPTVIATPTPATSSSSGSESGSTGITPVVTKKAPTVAPTPSPKPTTQTPSSSGNTDPIATVAPTTTKTPTPTSTKQSDSSSSGANANNTSSTASSKSRTILMAVIAGVAVLSIVSLLVLCCRHRRRRSDSVDEMATPAPILASNNHHNGGFHPSIAGVDRASGQLRDSTKNPMPLSINTVGYGGLPTMDNGLPKYAVTSPEMPSNYRASANQSRLADFSRRTRTGTMSSATGTTSPMGSSQPDLSFSNSSLRDTGHSVASSGFSIRGESEISLDRTNSYASQLSNDDSYPRITTNLKMNRFSRTSSMASSSLTHGTGIKNSSGDAASFINHDLTRSVSESTTGAEGEQLQSSMGSNDGKSWYKSIESPSEQDRYTANSDRMSLERESFEL